VRIDRLEISFFRNLSAVALDLNPGLNFLWGDNGAGKTAVLEAAYLLARGRSFRSQTTRSLIQHGAEALTVRASLDDDRGGVRTVAMSNSRSGHTVLKINGLGERRLSEAARLLPLQLMLPDIGELVFGGPQIRRQWLDWGTFHVKPEYLGVLRSYMRILRQRNAVLRSGAGRSADLQVWSAQLVQAAIEVDVLRGAYLERLADMFARTMASLAPELKVQMVYRRGWPNDEGLDKVLGEMGPREVKLGVTQAGPHRADIDLRVGDSKAAAVLSRGQGKALASALKVSQARLLAEAANHGSVFLIDDIGAELDGVHNARFFEMLNEMGCQILATSTQRPAHGIQFANDRMQVFHVEHGVVHRSTNG